MTPFTFTRHNRSPRNVTILICVYAVLIGLVILFNAAWWVVALLGMGTVPALWDIVSDTSAGMKLNRSTLEWHSGRKKATIPINQIDCFRFDTRWDFSVRVSVILVSGKRIRLPDEATPPHLQLENILIQSGLRVERHHFRVF